MPLVHIFIHNKMPYHITEYSPQAVISVSEMQVWVMTIVNYSIFDMGSSV